MIILYCRNNHALKLKETCPSCTELLNYAQTRLEKCPYQEQKPACSHCLSHCYKPIMRENIRLVMRYSGPRMFYHHPLLALHHLLAGLKNKRAAEK
jgi:hypothetical protein